MIKITGQGDFSKTKRFLERLIRGDIWSDLDRYGQLGVDALSQATPVNTGLTAESWGYRVIDRPGEKGIQWFNTNLDDQGTPVAILIQHGHGTRTGGYVQGRDFINPAMRSIFDGIANDVWKKVNA